MGEGDKIHETICVNLFFMNNPAGTKGTLGTPYGGICFEMNDCDIEVTNTSEEKIFISLQSF